MRKALAVSITFLFLVPYAFGAEFWASKNSNKYHYPNCRWAQKIKPNNLVKFGSPAEAIKAGYVPCKVCKPPVSSRSEKNVNNGINLAQHKEYELIERRGCCSWHGGWCGSCDPSTGKYICCDGTLSPSCYCW